MYNNKPFTNNTIIPYDLVPFTINEIPYTNIDITDTNTNIINIHNVLRLNIIKKPKFTIVLIPTIITNSTLF